MRVGSKAKIKEIESWIDDAIAKGSPGDRLPNAKALMKRFQVGQKVIQAAMQPYIEAGRLVSRRGLGTMIAAGGSAQAGASQWEGDLLVLRRTSESSIAANLIRGLERHLKADGLSLLQIGYTQQEQALDVLNSLGKFKVCLLQSHFQRLSIEFLAALNRHARHIIVDGAYITGVDVDSIGTDWRGALLFAFNRLRAQGHRDIGFLTSAHPARTIAMARREFVELSALLGDGAQCPILQLDALPGDYRAADIAAALEPYRLASGKFAFSALIAWGVVEGFVLDVALKSLGAMVPEDLSIIILGSVDLTSEHLGRFDVVGNSDAAKLEAFSRIVDERIADSQKPTENYYLDIEHAVHGSTAKID